MNLIYWYLTFVLKAIFVLTGVEMNFSFGMINALLSKDQILNLLLWINEVQTSSIV